ncbi:MAG: PBP1A family penicillin-binding protein [Pseudomonadota bacterium]
MASSGRNKPPLVAERRYRKSATGKSKPVARKPARRTQRKTRKRQGFFMRLISGIFGFFARLIWKIGTRTALVLALVIGLSTVLITLQLPPYQELVDGRTRGSVTFLDRDGQVFAWRGDQFGGMITADTVSPHLKNAIVATEDKRFYRHLGVSPRGVASAVKINLSEGRGPLSGHGGSTITQQTAKLLCLGVPFDPASGLSEAEYEADCRRGSLWRKAKEAVYALALETKFTKDEILTIYLNRAFLGAGSRGFEAAAERYFGKSAAEVNPSEAAMLAGLLVAPTRFAPTNNLQRSQDRANLILGLMEDQGYLSAIDAAAAKANPATLSSSARQETGGYFADWVMSTGPDFLTRNTTEDVVIRTTFDRRIQKAAEDAMRDIFTNKVREGSEAQAAIVVMSSDGAVRAIVGGRDTRVSGAFNRAVQAKRQTGSTFKPFVYAAAMEMGHSTRATVEDAPLTIDVPGSGPWSPKNYGGEYYGRVTLTEALARSLNTAAVRVSEYVGRENVRQIASDFGIKSDLAAGPALALGASEATLLETTGAYAGILNGGRSVTPYGVLQLRLQGDREPLMGQEGGLGERVISEEAAKKLTFMMTKVVEGGTGTRARLDGREVAGKTGTTDAARDAWFIGFTADYVAGVWMGYDDNRPLTGVTGGGLPAEIWHETMAGVHEGLPANPLPMLRDERGTLLAQDSGRRQERAPRRQRRQRDNSPERVIRNLISSILGGG